MSKAQKGKNTRVPQKKCGGKLKRKYLWITPINTFECYKEAALMHNLKPATLRARCCNSIKGFSRILIPKSSQF